MNNTLLSLLEDVGAVMPNDHFVGTSGAHFDTYINKDALYPHIDKVSAVGKMFAEVFSPYAVDVIAGPALGGIILSQWTAAALCEISGKNVLSIYAEKKDGGLQLTRGYDALVQGKRVAVVEDLTTTGGSLQKAIHAVQEKGGEVVAAAVMVNKNPTAVTEELFGIPFHALSEMVVTMYEAKECPLCKNGIPVNASIGHGKQFIESQQ